MRILLAGAAGFIGSHLTDRLLQEGHTVVGMDSLITGRRENLEHLDGHPRFQFVEHDVTTPIEIDGPLDWVMHFASPASPPKYLRAPIETLRVNAEGTFHLLELARTKGAAFFLASTSEVYGDPLVHPQPETYWGNVNPVGPRAVYDEGKRYAEAMVTAYHRHYELPIRIVRIFNTYGPRMDPSDGRVVTNFIAQALRGDPLTVYGEGSQTRSFCYVDDLTEGIARLMGVDYAGAVNLGNPEEYTVLDLARLTKEITGSRSEIVFKPLPQDDPMRRCPDITLAKKLLRWEPKIQLRTGLRRTISHFQILLEQGEIF